MAELRCPNCGKNNPPNLELCSFCYTRLKPTGELPPSSSDDLMSLLGGKEAGEEVPDWLRSLSPEEQTSPFTEDLETGGTEGEFSLDWLQQEPEPSPPPVTAPIEESPVEETSSSGQTFEETLDWLSSLEDQSQKTDQPANIPSFSDFSADETTIDWLDQTQEPAQASSDYDWQPKPEESAPEEDWLARLGTEGISEAEGAAPDFNVPQADETSLEFSFQELEAPPQTGEWTDSSEGTSFDWGEIPAEPAQQPDWLGRLGGQELEPIPPESAESIPAETSAFVSPFTESIEDFVGSEEVPDWFASAEAAGVQPTQQQDSPEEEIPDWLREAGAGASPFETYPEQDEISPRWMQERTVEAPVPGAGESMDETTPEWLSQTGAHMEGEKLDLSEPAEEARFATFETEEVPDWLAKFDRSVVEPTDTGAVPAFVLDEEPMPFEDQGQAQEATLTGFGETPDWLDQIERSQELPPVEAGEVKAQVGQDHLAPAELPKWLEAMRPSEGAVSGVPFRDTSDERVETGGFLAGLPGILSAEFDMAQVSKPPTYTNKLQVPQDQQERVDLVKALLADEERVAPVAKPAALPTPYILRLIILGAFILGAIFAFWAGNRQALLLDTLTIPQPVADLSRIVQDLPNNSPVLIAFDYEPGSIPELETAAFGVVDQLLAKGSILRTVSTNNMGPALAKRLLDRTMALPERLNLPAPDVAHLGYIPGGPSGLQAFARNPAGLMRYKLQSTDSETMDAWSAPVFNPDRGLGNFKLVLVITDNAESARGWIEQVGYKLSESQIPLIMIVSAQIEPMALPYYFTAPRQVAGVATGIMGGVFLENISGRDGPARSLLDAYSLILMVAVVLMLIGSLIHLVSGQMQIMKKLRNEGQA